MVVLSMKLYLMNQAVVMKIQTIIASFLVQVMIKINHCVNKSRGGKVDGEDDQIKLLLKKLAEYISLWSLARYSNIEPFTTS